MKSLSANASAPGVWRSHAPNFRLSVRTMLLAISLGCLWLGWRSYCARHEARAVNGLRAVGGQMQDGLQTATWRWWLLGRGGVTGISFLGPSISDADINEIARHASKLPDLARITFVETAVTEPGRQQLQSKMPNVNVELISPILDGPRISR